MLISEKQVMQLLYFTNELRRHLIEAKLKNILAEDGTRMLDEINHIISPIINQQSGELKVIE